MGKTANSERFYRQRRLIASRSGKSTERTIRHSRVCGDFRLEPANHAPRSAPANEREFLVLPE